MHILFLALLAVFQTFYSSDASIAPPSEEAATSIDSGDRQSLYSLYKSGDPELMLQLVTSHDAPSMYPSLTSFHRVFIHDSAFKHELLIFSGFLPQCALYPVSLPLTPNSRRRWLPLPAPSSP